MRKIENNNSEGLFEKLGKFTLANMDPVLPTYQTPDVNRKKYHSPEEIADEDSDEYERPDFRDWNCKICEAPIEEGYFWYYIRQAKDESRSVAVCSKECFDKLIKSGNYQGYEIYEYSRCNAYYKCQEIDNLRGMCELVENKTYQPVLRLNAINHCEPAQAGIILSTHKMTGVLKDFSKQTEKQYLSNKEMMEQGAEESTKQFKITTWMTVLVIFLTILNFVPMFFNVGSSDYSEQLSEIESTLSEIRPTKELNQIGTKLDEVSSLISSNTSSSDEKSIELLEIIKQELKGIKDPQE